MGFSESLYRHIKTYLGTNQPVVLNDAFSCFATDVITEYAFSRTYGFLDRADFVPNLRIPLQGLMVSVHYLKHFPWVFSIMEMLPEYCNAHQCCRETC